MAKITPEIQALIDQLPESGVDEFVDNLRSLIEFYKDSEVYAMPFKVDPVIKLKGRLLPTVIREPFEPDPPTLPKVTQLNKTGYGAPVRWEGMVDSGMHLEIEYRNNWLSCLVGNDEVFWQKVDSENSLYMDEPEMFKFLAGVLDFSIYAEHYPSPAPSSPEDA